MKVYIKSDYINLDKQKHKYFGFVFVPECFEEASIYLVVVKRQSLKRKVNLVSLLMNVKPYMIRKYSTKDLDDSWIPYTGKLDIDNLIEHLKKRDINNMSQESINATLELIGYLDYECRNRP